MPTYENVSCSDCGRDIGPGSHGFSHCQDHRRIEAAREVARLGAELVRLTEVVGINPVTIQQRSRALRRYLRDLTASVAEEYGACARQDDHP
mgnify:CR=1 FL=1